uniref:Cadherin_C domain-containing protein n=1 Tax=Mesocestoides corti TaxID=53468 RepID=A0A5K3FYB2_MESCO
LSAAPPNLALIVSLVVVAVVVIIAIVVGFVFWRRRSVQRQGKGEQDRIAFPDSNEDQKYQFPASLPTIDFSHSDGDQKYQFPTSLPTPGFSIAYKEPDGPIAFSAPVSNPVNVTSFAMVLSAIENNNTWNNLFESLRAVSNEQEHMFNLTQNAGQSQRNHNQYVDMLPYDQSMVILGRKWPLPLRNPR